MEKAKQNPAQILMQGVGFTQEDLEANREGRLSEAQRTWLRHEQSRYVVFFVLGLLGLLVSPWICSAAASGSMQEWQKTALYLVAGCAVICGIYGHKWDLGRHDLAEDEALVEKGQIRQEIREQFLGGRYMLALGDRKFRVDKDSLLAFKNGDPYRIYYAPYSKMLLSAEWLRYDEAEDIGDGKAKVQA